jgi:carbon storage regulator
MLVLTRKEGQSVVIDGRIKVVILSIGGSQIRLGIEAPRDVPILRTELRGAAAVVIGPLVLPKASQSLAAGHAPELLANS